MGEPPELRLFPALVGSSGSDPLGVSGCLEGSQQWVSITGSSGRRGEAPFELVSVDHTVAVGVEALESWNFLNVDVNAAAGGIIRTSGLEMSDGGLVKEWNRGLYVHIW